MSLLREYNESVEGSLVYTSTSSIEEQDGILYIEIYVTMIHTRISRITYVMSEDKLYVRDLCERQTTIIKNFSTITTEEQYFQQMTVQDCSGFNFEDVEPFMKNINRILDDSKFTTTA